MKETMALGYQEGMQTFDQHIYDLYQAGRISYENAIAYADSPNDLRIRIKVSGAKKARTGKAAQTEDGRALGLDNLLTPLLLCRKKTQGSSLSFLLTYRRQIDYYRRDNLMRRNGCKGLRR